jgi:DNA helicase HerA-like ATPase
MFIDEAHLIFNEASDALLNQIESIVKLIRSKGVGLYFVTQNPTDVPEAVLGQLGLKVQHALRAFTAKDRKAIKLTAQNYPDTEYYDTAEVLTSLGIGEALVSALNEKGKPTPLAATMMRAPMSRMDILTESELGSLLTASKLARKYNEEIDRNSAYEMLNKKIEQAEAEEAKQKAKEEQEALKKAESKRRTSSSRRRSTRQNPIVKVLSSPTVIRSVLGILTKMLK